MTILLHVLIGIALVQGLVALRGGWINARYARDWPSGRGEPERVLVFCPVRGVEPGLEANARSLLEQDHPSYRVVFLVDEEGDPAVGVLRSLGATVEAAGRAGGRSRKVHSLLHGVARFGEGAPVWVFADADARFPPAWLGELVAPLGRPGVGATTGYRWYVPESGWPSLVRSAWNATVAGLLGPGGRNFAWGGSTAIRRETFRESGIGQLWEHALSDDYALTSGVRRRGLGVVFVPTCLVPSHGTCSWRELLEFTTRQIRITRVYEPLMWRVGLASYTLFTVTFLWTTGAILFGRTALLLPWLALYALAVLRSEQRLRSAARAITHPSLERHRWFYRLSPPLVSLLFEFDFLASALSRRIVWKGVTYVMISPTQTLVKNGDREPFLQSTAPDEDSPPSRGHG